MNGLENKLGSIFNPEIWSIIFVNLRIAYTGTGKSSLSTYQLLLHYYMTES